MYICSNWNKLILLSPSYLRREQALTHVACQLTDVACQFGGGREGEGRLKTHYDSFLCWGNGWHSGIIVKKSKIFVGQTGIKVYKDV
jgi:hypothetical protein